MGETSYSDFGDTQNTLFLEVSVKSALPVPCGDAVANGSRPGGIELAKILTLILSC